MPGPIGLITKGIGSGIGLAAEAIAAHKEKRANQGARSVSPNPEIQPTHDTKVREDESDSTDSEDLDTDRAELALDEAAAELDTDNPPPYSTELNEVEPMPVDEVAKGFLEHHRSVLNIQATSRLPMPVILPQRRPKDKSRGFVRAYAPILGECAGIDQKTFIDFLNEFDEASKASPVFNVINLAAMGVGFVPNPIALGVSIAVQTVNRTAQEIQGRYRMNNFLDQINESLFKPRGLYAMIMTFKPDNPYDPVFTANINSTDLALIKATSNPDSQMRAKLKQIRLTSGTSRGEMSLPEAAPLIYPSIDAAAAAGRQFLPHEQQQQQQQQQPKATKSSDGFLASYLDRRAQAAYQGQYAGSKLAAAAPPPEKQFASRFSDPNHPANSGTILGLLTGGKFDPQAEKRVRKAQRRANKRGVVLSAEDLQNIKMGRGPRRKKGLIGRILHKDVLYFVVTNLPSESEMVEIRQEMDRLKSQDQYGSQSVRPQSSR